MSTALALDGQDEPHVVFTSNGLDYATHDVMGWHTEAVTTGFAEAVSIALGPDGTPYAAFGSYPPNALSVAKRVSGTWTTSTVDSGAVYSTSIAVDGAGNIHVAYTAALTLKYAVFQAATGTWVTSTIFSPAGVASLALDHAGQPHVAYSLFGNGDDLEYASLVNGTWTSTRVAPPCWDSPSLVIDHADFPQIACSGRRDGLHWFQFDGSTWKDEIADTTGGSIIAADPSWVGRMTSLAVDSQDRPHISYWVRWASPGDPIQPGQLHYATRSIAGWSVETVDRMTVANGLYSSIAIDSHDLPHISYANDACSPTYCTGAMYAEPYLATILGLARLP